MGSIDVKMVETWLIREIRRMIDLSLPYYIHEDRWGVPCGPTLAMVQPVVAPGMLYIGLDVDPVEYIARWKDQQIYPTTVAIQNRAAYQKEVYRIAEGLTEGERNFCLNEFERHYHEEDEQDGR